MKTNRNDGAIASLVVVGTGITFLSHLTMEAKAYITQSDKVLYLVNEPLITQWIQKTNPNHESLDVFYNQFSYRKDCYDAITQYILTSLTQYPHVCVAMYGHPTVFSQPALNAAVKASEQGYFTKVLPGISSEDCLYADLLINPGSSGCQSFEATDFLLRRRIWDPYSHLILWQVGIIGLFGQVEPDVSHTENIPFLQARLSQHYLPIHEIVLYEAAQYPGFPPKIQRVSLNQLESAIYSPLTTMYIAPAGKAEYDKELLEKMNIDFKITIASSN